MESLWIWWKFESGLRSFFGYWACGVLEAIIGVLGVFCLFGKYNVIFRQVFHGFVYAAFWRLI